MALPVFSLSPSAARDDLVRRLDALRAQDRRVTLIQGALLGLAALCVVAVAALSVEAVFRLSPAGRQGMLLVSGLVVLAAFAWGCGRSLIRTPTDEALACRVEQHYPDLNDRVTMALQLWRQRQDNQSRYSPVLIDAAIVESVQAAHAVEFSVAAAAWRITRAASVLGGTVLVVMILIISLFRPLSASLVRLSHPFIDYPVPPRTMIAVLPGDATVSKGSDVTVTVAVTGEMPDEGMISVMREEGRAWRKTPLTKRSPAEFFYTIRDIRQTLAYTINAGDATSRPFTLTVIDRPVITALHLTYRYPAYTRLAPRTTADGTGDIIALKGTSVALAVETSRPLASARLVLAGDFRPAGIPMTVNGRSAVTTLQVRKDDRYRVELTDREGRANVDPPEYRISVIPDRSPDVQIVSPGQDTNLTENMMVPLMLTATDDFGFSALRLVYRVGADGHEQRKPIAIAEPQTTTLSQPYVWDLSNSGLLPEDAVTYYVEVYDNDTVSGPKRGVSQTYTVRFPSMVEMYKQMETNQAEQITSLEEMLKEQKQVKAKLEDLARDLAKKPEPGQERDLSWEKKKDVESLMTRQQEMAEDLKKVAESLESMTGQLEQHDMSSLQLLEKMAQLQKLLQEIVTPELRKAMQDLKKSMEGLDKQKLTQAVKDFKIAQEDFMKRLERTLSILKRLQAEQKMDAAVKKAEELARRQEEIRYATQNAEQQAAQAAKNLAEKESALQRDTEGMEQELSDLAKTMEEQQSNLPADEVRETMESIQRQRMPQKMGRISQQLAAGQMGQAVQGQQEVEQDLSEMARRLQRAQAQMQAGQKQEIAGEMRRAMHDLLDLSQGEETLRSRTAQSDSRAARLQELAEEQQSLLKGASRVADQLLQTAQKSFFVSPQAGQALGEGLSRMQAASTGLEQRNRATASQQQGEAMRALNRAVLALRQAMDDLNAAGSATGLMEMLAQLQAMAQQQSGVNEQLNQMMQQGQGRTGDQMTMEERATIARLAAEQEALRKSLEQLQREMGQRSDVLGRLSEIEREMKESVQSLQQQHADPRLIDRQQRILSRLLDAQRSLRERDYDEKRQSKPGEDVVSRPSPKDLPASLMEQNQPLRDDLLRALRDGMYPKEYEDLIRAYFRTLSEIPQEQTP
ncbi:MAG: hypothetical protein HY710_16100 [Candidatus Latescibacteria bacterium]|nr:hypothetical protein [Candidatus Latescibacterota bacterium]